MKRNIIVASILAVVMISTAAITKRADNYFEIAKNLEIFGNLYRELNAQYVEEVDPTKAMRTAIDAMLKQMDPYTNYISDGEIEDYRIKKAGQFGGIGANVEKRKKKFVVTEPYQDYPAAKGGLLAGDVLLKIDNVGLEGKSLEEVRQLLTGEKGSQVILTIKRENNDEPIRLTLERDNVSNKNVPYYGMATEEVGYITLTSFMPGCASEVRQAYDALRQEHPEMKSLIFDLRGNPGGLVDQAVDIVNIWNEKGSKVVEIKGKSPASNRAHVARRPAVDAEMPLVVLVNGRSASASEIVSGAIQDLDRGVVVGERSFGKGLVQNFRNLPYNTQMKVTIAKYYTPSGRCIQAIDYAKRNEDGSVQPVPDSLRRSFKTSNGRTVYDGGGISPDVEVAQPKQHPVTEALVQQGMIFDFVTNYASSHDKIAGPREFVFTDAIYQEFMTYVKGRNFSYKTDMETHLESLRKAAKADGYESSIAAAADQLAASASQAKAKDMQAYRSEIEPLIRRELIQRYYFKEGVIEASFKDDPVVKEALKVLGDPARMKQILKN
ncbi:MAG: S41 family peptidase [Bacteroidia bacterium]